MTQLLDFFCVLFYKQVIGGGRTRQHRRDRGNYREVNRRTVRPAAAIIAALFHNLAIECATFRRMISTGTGRVQMSLAPITTMAPGDIADMIHAAGENASKQISQ